MENQPKVVTWYLPRDKCTTGNKIVMVNGLDGVACDAHIKAMEEQNVPFEIIGSTCTNAECTIGGYEYEARIWAQRIMFQAKEFLHEMLRYKDEFRAILKEILDV
jgi:hypothetical protein